MISNKKLTIIVPVYKDSENMVLFSQLIEKEMNSIQIDWEVLFVIDPDKTNKSEIIADELNLLNEKLKYIVMARRFGQAAAIQCGLIESISDAYVIMDVDGQDPINLIPKMLEHWSQGYKVVLPRRVSRNGENFIKLFTTKMGYWLLNKYSKFDIPKSVGDFRLIDKKIRDILLEIDDPYYFLRGNVAQIGFNYKLIEFDRNQRQTGITNYPKYLGSVSNAINAIFGYTDLISRVMIFFLIFTSLVVAFNLILFIFYATNLIHLLLFLVICLSFVSIFISGMLFVYILRTHDYLFKKPRFQVLRKSK